MLELTVKTLDSQNHSFTVPDEATVRQLKESILEKMDVPVETQRLIFHGKVLQDDKKLTDYGDVNGKVIHLVQRAPPSATRSNAASAIEIEDNSATAHIPRRTMFGRHNRIEGSNATYLGAMAFPADLMDAQGMIQPPPSQGLSRSRLNVAQRMLNRASTSIASLESSDAPPPPLLESPEELIEPIELSVRPGPVISVPLLTEEEAAAAVAARRAGAHSTLLSETTGSIAQAAQAATAAAIAAAMSAAAAGNMNMMRGGPSQSDPPPFPPMPGSGFEAADAMPLGEAHLNIDQHHPENVVAVEVEVGNSDVVVEERLEGDAHAANLDTAPNNTAGGGASQPQPRRNATAERTSSFATLIEFLEDNQSRFQPLLRRCHQLMVEDPSFAENGMPNAEECQRVFNGVSETMHHLAHAYHALSDIMVDFNEDTPRTLRCRPVLIQHSAILETGFPIQAQINLTTRRATNNNNENVNLINNEPSAHMQGLGNLGQLAAAAAAVSAQQQLQEQLQEQLQQQHQRLQMQHQQNLQQRQQQQQQQQQQGSPRPTDTPQDQLNARANAQPARAATCTDTNNVSGIPPLVDSNNSSGIPPLVDSNNASGIPPLVDSNNASGIPPLVDSNNSSGIPPLVDSNNASGIPPLVDSNNASGFYLSGPGNVEIFMDFGPEGVTLGSVETTVIRGNESRAPHVAMGGTGRPPMELLQSVQAVAGQIQNHILGRANQSNSAQSEGQAAEDSASNISVSPSASDSAMSNQSGASHNSQQSQNMQCPSHSQQAHPPRSNSSAESTTQTQTHAATRPHVHLGPAIQGLAGSSYDPFLPCNSHHIRSPRHRVRQVAAAAATTVRTEAEAERTANAQGAAQNGTGGLGDSFMAMMSQLLAPQRLSANRSAAGAGRSSAGAAGPPPHRLPFRRNRAQAEYPDAAPGIMGWTPVPSSLAGRGMGGPAGPTAPRRSLIHGLRARSNQDMINQFGPENTISDFLSSIPDNLYVEGESIVADFLMTLARNLTWGDIIMLSMPRPFVAESVITRIQPSLHTFVSQRLLQGESASQENIVQACERLYTEMRPYIDVMQEARLRESVDLTATINNYNQFQLPAMIRLIMDPEASSAVTFGHHMARRVRNYIRELIAIVIHCCQDGNQGFDTIVQSCVRLLTRGMPEELQQWTEANSVSNLRAYTTSLNVPLEEIQRYLVYRIPNSASEREPVAESRQEPMETDQGSEALWVATDNIASPQKVDEPIRETLVAMNTENLPDVLIGSEAWHNAIPSEWVPIIARDSQRQRRQSSQMPFSDAYLSSVPPKRRKIIAASKPQTGNLSHIISEGVRHAISASGVSTTIADRVVADAAKDDGLKGAYIEQEKRCVEADLLTNKDFTPSRFPNLFKYFK